MVTWTVHVLVLEMLLILVEEKGCNNHWDIYIYIYMYVFSLATLDNQANNDQFSSF